MNGSTAAGMSLSSVYGVARSLLTYYGPIWRRGRMPRFYRQFVKNGDLCFDLGAHVGAATEPREHPDDGRRFASDVVSQ